MELREYLHIALKWWWLFVLCTLLGGGAAFLVSSNMTPVYEASTLLMIGGGVDVVNPTTGELQTSEKLAQTYAELLKTRPVLEAVQAALGLPEKPEVQVALVRSTQLLRITASDTDPARAAATADALAEELILQSPSAPQRQEQQYRQFVDQQLSELQAEIDALTLAIEQARGAGLTDTASAYQEELNARRATYSSMLGFLSSSATNFIRVVEPAEVPEEPTTPKTMQNTLLAAVVGAILPAAQPFSSSTSIPPSRAARTSNSSSASPSSATSAPCRATAMGTARAPSSPRTSSPPRPRAFASCIRTSATRCPPAPSAACS